MQEKLFSLASFVSEHWCVFGGYDTHRSHCLWILHGLTRTVSRHCERWLMAVPSEFTATGSRKEKCRTVLPCSRITQRSSCGRCTKRRRWLPDQEGWPHPLSKHLHMLCPLSLLLGHWKGNLTLPSKHCNGCCPPISFIFRDASRVICICCVCMLMHPLS